MPFFLGKKADWTSLAIPLLVCLVLGLVEANGTTGQSLSLILEWLYFGMLGFLGHRISWLIYHELAWLPFTNKFSTQIPYLFTGIVLTFLMIYYFHNSPRDSKGIWVAVVVVAVSLLIHMLMVSTGTLQKLYQWGVASRESKVNLEVQIDGEKRMIPLESLLAVQVSDHYCQLWFEEEGLVTESMVHGSLKSFKNEAQGFLVQVNRSVLLNTAKIERFDSGKKPQLWVKGIDEGFVVSRSNKDLLKELDLG